MYPRHHPAPSFDGRVTGVQWLGEIGREGDSRRVGCGLARQALVCLPDLQLAVKAGKTITTTCDSKQTSAESRCESQRRHAAEVIGHTMYTLVFSPNTVLTKPCCAVGEHIYSLRFLPSSRLPRRESPFPGTNGPNNGSLCALSSVSWYASMAH